MVKLRLVRNSIFTCILFILSCTKGLQQQTVVYNNNFETNDLSAISTGLITTYNNSNVLGRYNNGGFELRLNDLPDHDLIIVTFDLNIHDSWDGNMDPDIWQMKIDGGLYINTTFSNIASPCTSGTCQPQSYPNNYLNSNHNPGAGSYAMFLPGACPSQANGSASVTSVYKIQKTIRHSKKSLSVECLDFLKQETANNLCDESWSVDNMVVKVVKLN